VRGQVVDRGTGRRPDLRVGPQVGVEGNEHEGVIRQIGDRSPQLVDARPIRAGQLEPRDASGEERCNDQQDEEQQGRRRGAQARGRLAAECR